MKPDAAAHAPVPFIVGAARSGTTLLRLMLDAHPDLSIGPESHFIPDARALAPTWVAQKADFVQFIARSARWPDFELDEAALRAAVEGIEHFSLTEGLRCFFGLYAAKFGKRRWGDKTPGYVLSMAEVQDVVPEARFVHLIRDGRDTALSVKDLWFGPSNIRDAADWWQTRIRAARRQAPALSHYTEVRFEQLVADPEAELRRICGFLELPWSDRILDYHTRAADRLSEINRPVRGEIGDLATGSQRLRMHTRVLSEPQQDRAFAWKRDMAKDDCLAFQAIAGDTLRELGYELVKDGHL